MWTSKFCVLRHKCLTNWLFLNILSVKVSVLFSRWCPDTQIRCERNSSTVNVFEFANRNVRILLIKSLFANILICDVLGKCIENIKGDLRMSKIKPIRKMINSQHSDLAKISTCEYFQRLEYVTIKKKQVIKEDKTMIAWYCISIIMKTRITNKSRNFWIYKTWTDTAYCVTWKGDI